MVKFETVVHGIWNIETDPHVPRPLAFMTKSFGSERSFTEYSMTRVELVLPLCSLSILGLACSTCTEGIMAVDGLQSPLLPAENYQSLPAVASYRASALASTLCPVPLGCEMKSCARQIPHTSIEQPHST